MLDILHREFVYLWYYFTIQLEQILPYWILGMVLGSAVSVFLKDRIHNTFRSLSEKRFDIFGSIIASALGIASLLCMYGTISMFYKWPDTSSFDLHARPTNCQPPSCY